MLALGMRLAQGGCGASVDLEKGFQLIMQSAKAGHAEAQHILGVVYDNGDMGQERDCKKAVAWYRKAASKGLAKSQFNLGVCWLQGTGVDAADEKKVGYISSSRRSSSSPISGPILDQLKPSESLFPDDYGVCAGCGVAEKGSRRGV